MTNREKAAEILQKRSGFNFIAHPELCTEPLLGGKIRMPARELLHVYFDIEQLFSITIPTEIVQSGKFDTFEHIVAMIEQQVGR